MTSSPGRDRSTDPAAPLRVVSLVGGLQVDATAVPRGEVRIEVIDQDPRDYDLVLRSAGPSEAEIARVPPAGDDRGEELVVDLAPGRYVLSGRPAGDPASDDLSVEFTVQPS